MFDSCYVKTYSCVCNVHIHTFMHTRTHSMFLPRGVNSNVPQGMHHSHGGTGWYSGCCLAIGVFQLGHPRIPRSGPNSKIWLILRWDVFFWTEFDGCDSMWRFEYNTERSVFNNFLKTSPQSSWQMVCIHWWTFRSDAIPMPTGRGRAGLLPESKWWGRDVPGVAAEVAEQGQSATMARRCEVRWWNKTSGVWRPLNKSKRYIYIYIHIYKYISIYIWYILYHYIYYVYIFTHYKPSVPTFHPTFCPCATQSDSLRGGKSGAVPGPGCGKSGAVQVLRGRCTRTCCERTRRTPAVRGLQRLQAVVRNCVKKPMGTMYGTIDVSLDVDFLDMSLDV